MPDMTAYVRLKTNAKKFGRLKGTKGGRELSGIVRDIAHDAIAAICEERNLYYDFVTEPDIAPLFAEFIKSKDV